MSVQERESGGMSTTRGPGIRSRIEAVLDRNLDLSIGMASILFTLLAFVHISGKTDHQWRFGLRLTLALLWLFLVLAFLTGLVFARNKRAYLRHHWIDAFTAALPFFGFLRLLHLTLRGIIFVRALIYGQGRLGPYVAVMRERHLFRIAFISCFVIPMAAALEFVSEIGEPGSTIHSYGDSLWWAGSTVTTVGSNLYPVTPQGQIIAFVLMLYGIGLFTYFTSSLASALIAGDARGTVADSVSPPARSSADGSGEAVLVRLHKTEVEALRSVLGHAESLQSLVERLDQSVADHV